MFIRIFSILALLVGVAGCATTSNKAQNDQIQNRVVELEKKLEEKDSEIVDLQYQVKDLSSKVESNRTTNADESEASSAPDVAVSVGKDDLIRVNTTPEKVQKALKAAGYYTGKIDGKIGPGTKAAIIAFQKSQGLRGDGIVGKRTWDALKKNLK